LLTREHSQARAFKTLAHAGDKAEISSARSESMASFFFSLHWSWFVPKELTTVQTNLLNRDVFEFWEKT
jgi:hypothetical protein